MQSITVLILTAAKCVSTIAGGLLWERISRSFLTAKTGKAAYGLRFLGFWAGISGPMWIGDENLLFFLPIFIGFFYLCYEGTAAARVVVGTVFYMLLSGLGMIFDTAVYFSDFAGYMPAFLKFAAALLAYLLMRKFAVSQKPLKLSSSMWGLCALLSLAPLFTILSFSLWNGFGRDQMDAGQYRIAYTVLPFVVLSAVAILIAMIFLSRQQELERTASLANMREAYYENLQQGEKELRRLRHDLRNHLSAALGLLEEGKVVEAKGYLSDLSNQTPLRGAKRICENEIANVVLVEKKSTMEHYKLSTDFLVTIPKVLSIADTDLCALLGNALDNAIEAAINAEDKKILLRARTDRGMFMLRVINSFATPPDCIDGVFTTTKENPHLHGFGISGMQEIATRYGGTLETRIENGRFELVACLPL